MKNYLRKNNFFEDAFDSLFAPAYTSDSVVMKTDIKETEKDFELVIDIPGFKKENVTLNFDNGYITVSAKKEQEEKEGKYIRRERNIGCSRSYYVGDIDKSLVKAKYDNGVLSITIPKEEEKKPASTLIEIE